MALAGLEVVSNASLELSELHEFEHVTAEELVTLAQSHVTPQTDAICIAGTDIAAMDAAKSLQDELGLPVVATNRALFDAAMRMEARR
jgi:maleate cis-trans isomerase